MAKKIILRVQSSEGTKRVEVDPSDTSVKLFEKVQEGFGLPNYSFTLHKDKTRKEEITSSRSHCVSELGLNHGDTVFLSALNSGNLWSCPDPSLPSTSGTNHVKNSSSGENLGNVGASLSASMLVRNTNGVVEDDVDLQLWKMDGKVKRKRDEKFCHHGSNACCVHCSPLEPFDESYLAEQQVKHMSFHAYLRKLTAGVDRGKFACLEEVNCRIKPGCKGHPPWPRGICSKCQPSAVTLNRQAYRHVDNVQFENPHLVERFLNYWRTTGHQRIGFLYGHYEVHTDVPLGIRATVAVIYEPPQESTRDKVVLCPDEKEPLVDELAKQLGLRKVGWIFTDLLADDLQKGTVKHVRNIDSHFLTAQECIMAGHFQNLHPNPCRFSPSGYFGSKFVTVCVTGDSNNQVFMEGYGVSNQCTALVRHNCLVPTKDAPELGFIRESSNEQYVPDVYYKLKDSYGNEVSKLARPLPVEYLLVDVPVSTPRVPQFTFTADPAITPFPVGNRMIDEHLQDFSALSRYLSQFSRKDFLAAVSDFHFLLYVATMDMLPMKDFMGPLLEAIRDKNNEKAIEWSQSENWATLEQVISASRGDTSANTSFTSNNTQEPNTSTNASDVHPDPSGEAQWTCPYCTFLNLPHLVNCEMCNLPR
nr:PREDICTED: nuclear protein localization protein 4 homolog [Bemisia tabaci]